MKKKTSAVVVYHSKISEGIYDLWLETELAKEAKAGQFIGVYPTDKSKLLPRPISICQVHKDGEDASGLPISDKCDALRLVYRVTPSKIAGAESYASLSGTANISEIEVGEKVDILGILGNGYDLELLQDKDVVLMGGGIGIPPMLELAKEIVKEGMAKNLSIILGYRDSNFFLKDDFERLESESEATAIKVKVYIATEDGSSGTKGNVLNVMKEYESEIRSDIICSCGPMPMLRAIATYAKDKGIKAYISLEERMACGVGACLGCITKTKEIDHHSHVNNTRICTDGPVFDAEILDL